jgi:multidrug efflux pump subunit AcrB
MKLPRIALENYQFTLVMFVMLISLGVVSFLTMPRSEDPQVSPVASSIYIVYPGASPEDMETLIVDPLEQALNELDDIDKMDTDISDGLAHIRIEFLAITMPMISTPRFCVRSIASAVPCPKIWPLSK